VARRLSGLLAGALAALCLAEGMAMMMPEEYRKARDGAQFHLQLEIRKVTMPARTPGICTVEGVVARVFRGALAAGTPMQLALSCKRRDERAPPGGEHWTFTEDLARAKYLEAYVNREAQGYAVAAWQSDLIATPSDQPQFSGKE
jgi:hypothetical protein